MSDITTQSDFLNYIKSEAMGNGNLTIRGVARCCGVDHTAIFRGGDFRSEKLGQKLMGHGFEAGDRKNGIQAPSF